MERANDDIDLVVEGDGVLYADKLAEVGSLEAHAVSNCPSKAVWARRSITTSSRRPW